jgi:branched-chain amino acid transport system substrate-binding protein
MKTHGTGSLVKLLPGLLFVLFWLVPVSAAPAPDAIVIGCTLPLTGRFAGNGIEVKDGYEIAVQHINDAGGIFIKEFGKKIPVKLLLYDDESDPQKAVTRYEKMNTDDKVVAYLGGFSTTINASLVAIAEKNKIPIVVSHFGQLKPHRQGYKYLFSPFQKATPDHPKLLDAAAEIFGKDNLKTVAFVMSRSEAAFDELNEFKARIAREGQYKDKEGKFKTVVEETYPLGATDFSMIIAKAKAANAQIWISHPTPPEGIAMMRQMKELDYNPQMVDMTQASSDRGWPGGEHQIGEFVSTLESWIPGLPWPGNDRLIADAKKRLGGKLPWCGVGTGYMDVQVLANAIERAGALDREKIRDALTRTEMMTVGGPVKVRPDGTFELNVYLCQWQKGAYVPVWPKKYAVAKPILPMPKWSER